MAALAKARAAGLRSAYLKPTWNLQEVLNEADVALGLRRQLLEAPDSLSAAAPAGQRLILHCNLCQNVHVRCDKSTLV